MTALPDVNTLVRVVIDDDGLVLPSRVESVEGPELLVAAPSYVGDLSGPREGTELSVHWTSVRGVCSIPVQFVGAERAGIKLWRLRSAGSLEMIQRRRFARVETGGALSVVGPDLQTVRVGWMLDLSEGGVRARMAPGNFGADDPVEVRINMDGEVVSVVGQVVRTLPPREGFEEVIVCFPEDHPAANAMRRYVFAEQARLRRLAREIG